MIKKSKKLKESINRKAYELKNRIGERLKGGPTMSEMLVIIAVLLLVTYPLYKDTMHNFFLSVQAWLTNATKGIFV